MKKLYTDFEDLVLKNRSLCENDPLKLLGRYPIADAIFTVLKSNNLAFIILVNDILDKNE